MDEASITRFITEALEGVDAIIASGNTFFIYAPCGNLPPERRFPFATLVTSDEYDSASDLNRPSVFRLNIGVSRGAYGTLFAADADHDFTTLDRLMPHPVYAAQSWVCILNPGDATFREVVLPLLREAHERAVARHAKHAPEE